MKCRRLGNDFFVVILFFSIKNASVDADKNNLKRLLNYNSKSPFVAVFFKNNLKTIKAPNTETDDVIIPDVKSVEPPHDQKLYDLYTILRTAQENEDVDSEAEEVFDKTENILREALRVRCNRLDKCVKKCPKKKKYTCTLTCKEAYDDYDVCEKPKKKKQCKKPKCGKTMPPSWILRD